MRHVRERLSRNGYSSKTILTDDSEFELTTPRGHEGTFEPQLINKKSNMYNTDISPTLISKVTDAVKEQVSRKCRYKVLALDKFAGIWDEKYPQISKSWHAHWKNLNTFFRYPPDIRQAMTRFIIEFGDRLSSHL